jgi:hypothetical protein
MADEVVSRPESFERQSLMSLERVVIAVVLVVALVQWGFAAYELIAPEAACAYLGGPLSPTACH